MKSLAQIELEDTDRIPKVLPCTSNKVAIKQQVLKLLSGIEGDYGHEARRCARI